MRDNNVHVYAQNLFKFFPEYVKTVFKNRPVPEFASPPYNRTVQAFGTSMTADNALKMWCADKKNVAPLAHRLHVESFTTLASVLGFQGSGGVGRSDPIGEQLLMGKHGALRPGSKKAPSQAVGSVLILDEVQSLFKPSGKSEDYVKAASWLRRELTNSKYKKYMYVFALTGTPGGTVNDILSVINFVRPLNVPRIQAQDLNKHPEYLKGFVSYVELRGDTSVYGIKNVHNAMSEMDPKYYAGYLKTIKTVTDKDIHAEKRPGYMSKFISAGNALTTKTAITGIYSDEELERLARRDMTGGIPASIKFGSKIAVLSPKLREAIKNVISSKGKQNMYVMNATTAFVIMAMLNSIGYSGVDPKNPSASMSAPGKRYVYYKQGDYTFGGKKFSVDAKNLNGIKKALADGKNINGDYIKVVIATGTFYQGFDTPGLTGVHIVDVLHDVSADIQAVGRALRMCGHSKSALKTVNVFRYFSVPPKSFSHDGISKRQLADIEKTATKIMSLDTRADLSSVNGPPKTMPPGINSFVFADAVRKNKAVAQTEKLLKSMAVDCQVFKNVFHSNQNFQCSKPVFVDIESSRSPKTPFKKSPGGLMLMSPRSPPSPTSAVAKTSSSTKTSSAKTSSTKMSSFPRTPSPSVQRARRYSPGGESLYKSAVKRTPSASIKRQASAPSKINIFSKTQSIPRARPRSSS